MRLATRLGALESVYACRAIQLAVRLAPRFQVPFGFLNWECAHFSRFQSVTEIPEPNYRAAYAI
jgi:hypothetical protein